MKSIKSFLKNLKVIKPIVEEICKVGGIPYLVGGSVRDLVMDIEVKDWDIEVHKISIEDLQKTLQKFGTVSLVGAKFGVFKFTGSKLKEILNLDLDWALPRRDTKGRKPKVEIDPTMTMKEACRRRDLTINAMAIDLCKLIENLDSIKNVSDVEIVDPFDGLKDLENKILRAVDEKLFEEDPLRFYRVMQFSGRFKMEPDKKLNEICKKIDLTLSLQGGEIARERIFEEIKKLFLKSKRPSIGFRWLKNLSRLKELFPELGALDGINQRKDYHPEIDAFEHTMQSLDASALISVEDEQEKFMIMLAVLCHDFGKALTTDETGKSKGHSIAGIELSKNFLKRLTDDRNLIKAIPKLVRYHRMPLALVDEGAKSKAYKRLAVKLSPDVTPKQLYWVSWCDIRGRNVEGHEPLQEGFRGGDKTLKTFLKKIKEFKVETGPEKPVLLGRHITDIVQPGPKMGKLLEKAYEIQIDEGITDVEELKQRVLKN